jgi:predicted RNase H-like HicB family nuclease
MTRRKPTAPRRGNTRHFPVIVEQDEAGFFVATNPALPGCYSQGTSMEEALANVREATEASLAERPDTDVSIPNISVHVIAL